MLKTTIIAKSIIIMIIAHAFYTRATAQTQQHILPLGLHHEVYERLPTIELALVDSAVLKVRSRHLRENKPGYFAHNIAIDFSSFPNDEKWIKYSEDLYTWQLKIKSKGALGLALVFSNITLKPSEKLFVYNLNGMIGPFDIDDISDSRVLPTDYLWGDEIIIEFNTPYDPQQRGGFLIETVSHAYLDIFSSLKRTTSAKKSERKATSKSDCYLCIEGELIEQTKRAVVKIIVHQENATKICTGTLVNNTARDKRPYVLTAEHCIKSQGDAERTVFIFNFDETSCNGDAPVDNLTLSGSSYRASLYENDFSLVELNDPPPMEFRPYYAGWSIADDNVRNVMSIHHARGGPKTISLSLDAVTARDFEDKTPRAPNGFWRISRWDAGATEGGSSGAPLFNSNHLVIGTLTGGSSECGSPFNDYFQRLSKSWEPIQESTMQLKYWLDPLSSNLKSLSGMDPFEGITPVCDSISNLKVEELPELIPYPGGGYFSGYNIDSITTYAEKFHATDTSMLTGALINTASVNKDSQGGILVAIHLNDNGLPGSILYETFVPYFKLGSNDEPDYISFYPFVGIIETFFISFTMSYSPNDVFAVMQSPWRTGSKNTAYIKLETGWAPLTAISPQSKGASLDIKAITCRHLPEHAPDNNSFSIELYPNPATSMLLVKFAEEIVGSISIQVSDLQGKIHEVNHNLADANLMIRITDLSDGMYILRCFINGRSRQVKFFKQ